MTLDELRKLITDKTADGTLTLTSADLGTGRAAGLVKEWLDGTFTLTDVQRTDPEGKVVLSGSTALLGVESRPVSGVEFAIDSDDSGQPSFFFPFGLPKEWSFGTSFPPTEGSDLAALSFVESPELLLTSRPRAAEGVRPALPTGCTFRAPKIDDPAALGALFPLVRASDTKLAVTGTIRTPETPVIALRSVPRAGGKLGSLFFLWAGSRTDDGNTTYGLRIAADLTIATGVGATISAALAQDVNEIVLNADALPADPAYQALADWDGSGMAAKQLTEQGFGIGDKVRLTELSLTIDRSKVKDGLTKAVAQVKVVARTNTGATWPLAGGSLVVTEVGADLTVNDPLQASPPRAATVTGYGKFLVAQTAKVNVTGVIPPGTLAIDLDPESKPRVADVVKHFWPQADLKGVPDLTLESFTGSVTPKAGEFAVSAKVTGGKPFTLGAAQLKLKEAGVALNRIQSSGGQPVLGEEGPAGHQLSGQLSAKAALSPATGANANNTIDFDASWTIPKTFELGAQVAKVELTKLLKALACDEDIPLPQNLPDITLTKCGLRFRAGSAQAMEAVTGFEFELFVATGVSFNGNDKLTLAARAAKDSEATLLAAALWQDGWTWSPKDITAWAKDLAILKDITFTKSGLALCSRDGTSLKADKLPETMPETLKKGLTFFCQVGFTGALAPLGKLLADGSGIQLQGVLTSPVKNCELLIKIAEKKVKKGFGGFELRVQPAKPLISLDATWYFELPSLNGTKTSLAFLVGGSVWQDNGAWTFTLYLALKAVATAAGTVPGEIAALRRVLSLDAPGYMPPPRDPADVWAARELARVVTEAQETIGEEPPPPPPEKRPTWKNAFGIQDFDIAYFYVQVGYTTGSGGLTLGGGGQCAIGKVQLELDVAGVISAEPYLNLFHFALNAADRPRQAAVSADVALGEEKKGVSLWEILNAFCEPSEDLKFLDQIVLHDLMVCYVLDAAGWENPVTKEKWAQGFHAKGNIDFSDNNWRFELSVGLAGIWASSDIAQPVKIGTAFTLSDATGKKGPSFSLDTRAESSLTTATKIFTLSGKLTLLTLTTTVEAELGNDGFHFTLAANLVSIFDSSVSCTYKDKQLTARGKAKLANLQIKLDKDVVIGWAHIKAGTPFTVDLGGSFDLYVKPTMGTARIDLDGSCTASLGGVKLVDFKYKGGFGVSEWTGVSGYLTRNPEKLLADLGKGIWDEAKRCALGNAGKLM
ncbi:hypothetical protein [Streptomyces sp. NPDC007100]|uniref:hypothetical protein n=1 Tax=Streptomyces sp. NPDC007100 TaxID=3155602 RepID=UPI0033E9589C